MLASHLPLSDPSLPVSLQTPLRSIHLSPSSNTDKDPTPMTHRVRLVLQHPVHILDHDVIFDLDQLGHFGRYPTTQYGQVDFTKIDFFRKRFGKLCRFDSARFFVFEPLRVGQLTVMSRKSIDLLYPARHLSLSCLEEYQPDPIPIFSNDSPMSAMLGYVSTDSMVWRVYSRPNSILLLTVAGCVT